MNLCRVLAICMAAFFSSVSVAQTAPQIPVEDFLKRDVFGTLRLSPDGEYIAATVPMEDRTSLVILRRSDMKQTGHVTFPSKTHVNDFYWVNPTRILFTIGQKQGELNQPRGTGEIYGVNVDGKGQGVLVGFGAQSNIASQIKRASNYVVADILDTLRDDDNDVIISTFRYGSEFTEVFKMNVDDGRRVLVAKAPVRNAGFVTDQQGVARFAVGAGNDNLSKTYYRAGEKSDWVLINDEDVSSKRLSPIGFSADNQIAYLQAEEATGPDAIYQFDTNSNKQTLLIRDNNVDPSGLETSPIDDSLYAVSFNDGYPRYEYLDKANEYAVALKKVSAAFKDKAVVPLSYTRDGKLGVFAVYSDTTPTEYYLLEKETNKLSFIAAKAAWLKPEQMAGQDPYELTMRDGLKVEAFLTLPKNSTGKNLPLVVHPHGGPFGPFDQWGFNPQVQLLANRGYAVLQVNFRGSGNYGRAFLRAGHKQWGGTMQDDLTDATKWAIKSGIADPRRICIYGASYGGYASLMGVAKEPDLYRCAIGNVGVYDMKMMYGRGDIQGNDSGVNFLKEALGEKNLDAASPNKLASRIKVPVLLLAGREDERAPPEHTEVMARALQQAGKSVEMKIYTGEGHGNYLLVNQIDFANRVLNFLDKHIGPSSQKAKVN